MKHVKAVSCVLTAALLAACGGGGGGGGGSNNVATIAGVSNAAVSSAALTASGALTVADADSGQAAFGSVSGLSGLYGTWTWTPTGSTGQWSYALDAQRIPSVPAVEQLTVKSVDGSATQVVTVSIAAGSGLVTSVAAPVYSGAYASEKTDVFNRLNADRARCGFGKLAQNTLLDQAAQNHADYHALNKLSPTHRQTTGLPGFTGVDQWARLDFVGYNRGPTLSENLAQDVYGPIFTDTNSPNAFLFSRTETPAMVTLRDLYATVYHLVGLMWPSKEVGLGVSTHATSAQDGAKTVVFNLGTQATTVQQTLASSTVATFPCEGTTGVSTVFLGETPDPFPNVNRNLTPYGQPVYVVSGPDTTLTLTSGTITLRGGSQVPTTVMNRGSDPAGLLQASQIFLVPTVRLADNATYDVVMTGTSTGLMGPANPTGAWSKSFSFTTGTRLVG